MTHSPQDGSSTQVETSSSATLATAGELVVAHRDPVSGHIVIPTPIEGAPLEFRPGAKCLTEEQHELLGPLGIRREWSPAAVAHFLMDARRRGFDPYGGEIFLLQYRTRQGDQYVHHIGIHGMRRHVIETRLFRGIDPMRYCGDDGKWLEIWPYRDVTPYACKVVMQHAEFGTIEQVGYYDEFAPMVDEWVGEAGHRVKTGNQVPSPMWRPAAQQGKPTIMLSKCTRAMAFREGWPARFTNWYEPTEMDRMRVESDQIVTAASNDRAARREAAYAASGRGQTVDGDQVGAVLLERPAAGDETVSGMDRVRAMLTAELAAQAAIVGQTPEFLVTRWQQGHGKPWAEATVSEQAAHLQAIRPYVVRALRDGGRHETADRYAEAPMPGTLAELFGTPQVPAMATAAAA